MKILVLGSRVPYPQKDGGAIATYSMLKALAEQGLDVTYFTLNTQKHFVTDADIRAQFPFCNVIPVYLDTSPKIWRAIQCLVSGKNYIVDRFDSITAQAELNKLLDLESFDIIQFEGLYTIPFLHAVLGNSTAKLVFRPHNVEFRIWENLAASENNLIKKWYVKLLAKTLKKYELSVTEHIRNIAAISASDLDFFLNSSTKGVLYQTGMEFTENSQANAKPALPFSICHLGSMEWMPNVQGVQWFIANIWPEVLLKFPQASFHIAGKSLQVADERFKISGVVNHGEVDSAKEFLETYSLVCVPLLSGSGLRIKTLEAMAIAKPVISTSLGAEGFDYQNGLDIVVADNPSDWVIKIAELFDNPEQAKGIGKQAQAMVKRHYSLKENTQKLIEFYHSLHSKNLA